MKKILSFLGMSAALACGSVSAVTPAGGWTLADESPNVKDYFFQIEVDPGETSREREAQKTTSPSSVYFAQYVVFESGNGGYLGLQRSGGTQRAITSFWQGDNPADKPYFNAVGGAIPTVNCYEFGACSSIQGTYQWKVGHQYRFRVERSPVNPQGWWRVILTDLTTSRADVLGELQTPVRWGGLRKDHGLFLEYFWGPYQCDTLRHSRVTYMPPQGNFGGTTALAKSDGSSYQNDDPMKCDPSLLTDDMTQKDIDSRSYLDAKKNVIGVGNAYRGLHPWPNYSRKAIAGLMYAADPEAATPVLYRALRSGALGAFPGTGKSNTDWQYVGKGYPVINDLYLTGKRLYEWDERNASQTQVGDLFIYDNPYNKDVEYFRKARANPGYFPIDKSSNADWTYVGRHAIKGEAVKSVSYKTWGQNNRYGKVGDLFDYGQFVFRLKTEKQYWYFPTSATNNDWWEFVDFKR